MWLVGRLNMLIGSLTCTLTLLYLYKCYVRLILEFGCVLFSGISTYWLRLLFTLEKHALRLYLGLPQSVANDVLYMEARSLPLMSRFRYLTVSKYVIVFEGPFVNTSVLCFANRSHFMGTPWRHKFPQVLFTNSELSSMHVSLENVNVQGNLMTNLLLIVNFIIPSGAKRLAQKLLENILDDFLCEHGDQIVLATDGSVFHFTVIVRLIPLHIKCICVVWVPGHVGLYK